MVRQVLGTSSRHEAALVRHYPRLVGIAYLTLPVDRKRHSRVLAAHAAVQRALPTVLPGPRTRAGIGGGTAEQAYQDLRLRVLRAALAPARARRPRFGPLVWGLRLFTPSGDQDELALDRELAGLAPAARAAFALRTVEQLTAAQTVELLGRAEVADPAAALLAAGPVLALAAGDGTGEAAGLRPAFDACHVRVQPTDLLRRRRTRAGVLVLAGAGVAALLTPALAARPVAPAPVAAPASAAAAEQPGLRTEAPDRWRSTARVDFTAWPARGDRLADGALLGRALTAWTQAGPGTAVEPGTAARPPIEPPRLLFAGSVDGTPVVLLHDGMRIARYTDGPDGGLLLGGAEDSDVTSAAAVVLRRSGGTARYLLAPWIDTAGTRRLDQPDTAAKPLARTDGVTDPVPVGGGPGCPGDVLLELRSTPVVAEKHAFVLADVGGLRPARLSWTPPPEQGQARSPREAVSPEALRAWARSACTVPDASPGVRQLNLWDFATQQLPGGAGPASWLCLRSDRWGGEGSAATAVLLPTFRGAVRTGRADGRACSRYEQDTVAWTWWRSPQGGEYLLAAVSRRVARLQLHGQGWAVDQAVPNRTLAVPRPARDQVAVEAVQENGTRLQPLVNPLG
ncbi:hypothetical protein [Kitasatospora sp. NPDC002040]|uniref:hypothetical protein n=1 Tax=Kitasatospora sp. NPDC002040 TaxID=3154661 RepID=UPI003332D6A8